MIKDDGDIVRGLGFVVMNSAHLEGWVNELLFHLDSIEEYTEKQQRWPISRKIKKIKSILSKSDDPLAAKEHHTQYQKMIRNLLDQYTAHYSNNL